MAAQVFWIFGAMLSVLAILLMASGGLEIGGILDYKVWLLLALGILAVVIGNFTRTPEDGG